MELLRDGRLTDDTDLEPLLRGKAAILAPDDDDAWVDYWAEVRAADGRDFVYFGTRMSYAKWVKRFIQ